MEVGHQAYIATVPKSLLHTISFPMLSENSWAQVHQNKRHPSDTSSFDFGLGCPVARPPHTPPFLPPRLLLSSGEDKLAAGSPLPPWSPLARSAWHDRRYMQGRHSGKSYDCSSIHIQCAKVTAASGHLSSTFFVLASNSVNIVAITLLVLLVGTIMFLAIRQYVPRPCNTLGKCGGATGMFVSP